VPLALRVFGFPGTIGCRGSLTQSNFPSTISFVDAQAFCLKTDSLFYRIFQTAPSVFFELLGQPTQVAQSYQFRSIELKQVAFRIDGVFLPQPEASDQTIWFAEVQFQLDLEFYNRFFAEIFLFLQQYPQTADWRAVVLFAKRSTEPSQSYLFRSLLELTLP
jgi:predicted transposase YdaD